MKVLIADFDLYSNLGGGQTFYRSLIHAHPGVDFYFLQTPLRETGGIPKNAVPIRCGRFYRPRTSSGTHLEKTLQHVLATCLDIAASVSGHAFEIVDSPDYRLFGVFLRQAMRYHNVQAGAFALSLHGTVSSSLAREWHAAPGDRLEAMRHLELLQFEAADVRYGISSRYAEEWRLRTGLPSFEYDPLRVVSVPSRIEFNQRKGPAEITFVGRLERRKGPDLVVDMASAVPREHRGVVRFVGGDASTADGVSVSSIVRQYADWRCVDVALQGSETAAQLAHRLTRLRPIVVVPSRYDTFNLVALEALLSGAPTFIGSGAGVCDYLDSRFPRIPYFKVDTENAFASSPMLHKVLGNYDSYADELQGSLESVSPQADGEDIEAIYGRAVSRAAPARSELDQRFAGAMRAAGFYAPRTRLLIGPTLWAATEHPSLHRTRILARLALRNPGTFLKRLGRRAFRRAVDATSLRRTASEISVVAQSARVGGKTRPGESYRDRVSVVGMPAINRGRVLEALAVSEARGPLESAAYGLRLLRYGCQEPRTNDIASRVDDWLSQEGLLAEKEAARLLYGTHHSNADAVQKYLADRLGQFRKPDTPCFDVLDDHRVRGLPPRASVIVSFYNGADKLRRFLSLLSTQTIFALGGAELILIDSGSSSSESAFARQMLTQYALPSVYGRTRQRETIQAAWNHGLTLSQSEYVAFLGVDEALRPDALHTLASLLDEHRQVDWVMADSIVTDVSADGDSQNDVMIYDRAGFDLLLHILECCYLSYVGGLYRKRIHERVGFYDTSFRAAGDTEFKNRALPFITAMHCRERLGLFLNYPDARVTQNPRAEVEDLRAWYLFRSPGGVRYLTQNATVAERRALLKRALAYRKSYRQTSSQDIDLADSICESGVLASDTSLARLGVRIRQAKDAIHRADWMPNAAPAQVRSYMDVRRCLLQLGREYQRCFGERRPRVSLLNDNLFEQHSNVW